MTKIPNIRTTTDIDEFYSFVYPEYKHGKMDSSSRAILSLRNSEVDKHNDRLSEFLPGKEFTLYSSDSLNVDSETSGI